MAKEKGLEMYEGMPVLVVANSDKQDQITGEWIKSLPKCKQRVVEYLYFKNDFLVLGDAMPFIEEIASAFEYNIVYVKLQTLDDLRGTPVVKHDEKIGRHYFYCVTDWEEAIKNSQQESLLIFNIDEADDRLVNALKSIVERHGDEYFVGLICTDKTRKLGRTTTISLVRSIRWE